MLPVVRGEETTRRHILLYLGATLLSSVVLGITTRLDWLYAMTIVLVGSVFLWTVLRLFREQTEQAAFRTFHASNAYLGCLLLAIFTDALLV
jgi:protoheme IX farnesyltransferase